MKKDPRLAKTALHALAAAILCATPALHAQSSSAYLTDTRGNVVRNATYLCWHTGYWSPAAAIAECDPDLVPKPAPAAAAPVGAPPPARQAPAADNRTREGRARNRRVEIEVIGNRR